MLNNAYCLLNHDLTQKQTTELKEKFKVENIIYPSEELSKMWSQVPAAEEFDMNIIKSVVSWLSAAQSGDVLIVQGEFGSTFMIVEYALKRNLIPVHAVTKRVACEQRNGEIVSRQYVFEHVCFRKYKVFPYEA